MEYNVSESAKRIKRMRKDKGYTQEKFAEKIHISVRTYSGIESGAHGTSLETMAVIAKALDTSLDYIVFGKCESDIYDDVPEEKIELAKKIMKGILENL